MYFIATITVLILSNVLLASSQDFMEIDFDLNELSTSIDEFFKKTDDKNPNSCIRENLIKSATIQFSESYQDINQRINSSSQFVKLINPNKSALSAEQRVICWKRRCIKFLEEDIKKPGTNNDEVDQARQEINNLRIKINEIQRNATPEN